ncbi:DUF6053 domain-containing protein [Lysobacter enzymogenes]|uniref:DUF6053 domain-containing protein n=1 Tax=Lysobacter enzymogenes TaxID=69 RepID=UPI003D18961A
MGELVFVAHARPFVFGGGVGGGIVFGHGRTGVRESERGDATVGGTSVPMLLSQIAATRPEGIGTEVPATESRLAAVCNSASTSA